MIEFLMSIFSKEGTLFDRWIDKKLNAYGWRGFLANLLCLGALYSFLFYLREITIFFGGDELTRAQELTYQARMYIVNIVSIVILALIFAKFIKQYVSKEEREAHKEIMRKDALMKAEIIQRQKELKSMELDSND